MSEFKLQSPPSQRVYLYVNPYTHDYEITNIPTKYQVQHIGYYVGSFFSYHPLAEKDVYHNTSYKIMDQTALDKRYGEHGSGVYLGILSQPFYPHFSSFFLKIKIQDHFSKFLKHLKNNTDISYNSFIIT